MSSDIKQKLIHHLEVIYPDEDHAVLADRIIEIFWPEGSNTYPLDAAKDDRELWSEKSSILITYGDSLLRDGETPLNTLHKFLMAYMKDVLSGVHILPFFPYSSDDGFSVMDYRQVREDLGDWEDVSQIGQDFELMSDLVLNHASAKGTWFSGYLKGEEAYKDFFIEVDPAEDLSHVVRPRSLPLLTEFQTSEGKKHLWSTFSDDQIDLNYENPEVLLKIIGVMKLYCDHHVKILRLDAVGFLWKIIGTTCIHLSQTHEVMKLFRTLMNYSHDDVTLITETNVPHVENISYFGNQDEAHVVYNFTLPPLLIYGLLTGDEAPLHLWMKNLSPLSEGCTFLNFVAGHDGVGLRPAGGFLATEQISYMIETVKNFGGEVSMRAVGDSGEEKPYEMNVSLFDAMKGTVHGKDEMQRERFMASQTFMLGFQGIPALYIHSLLATPNDYTLFNETGHKRSLNRHRWDMDELQHKLDDKASDQFFALHEIKRLLELRKQHKAFHPDARQITLDLIPGLVGFKRISCDKSQYVLCITNLTADAQSLNMKQNRDINGEFFDILTDEVFAKDTKELEFAPYQTKWLKFSLV